jgi:LemA protein
MIASGRLDGTRLPFAPLAFAPLAFAPLAFVLLAVLFGGCGYNTLVTADEQAKSAWAQVENVYQRRADLIPNLVATVKGSAQHEEKTLAEVTAARASATQIKLSADDLRDPDKVKAFEEAQARLGASLGRLLAVSESYPDLKANAAFRDLQAQLEGTENRIAVERKRYNDAVRDYNVRCREFPTVLAAKIWGFRPREPFKATAANAERAPEVKF